MGFGHFFHHKRWPSDLPRMGTNCQDQGGLQELEDLLLAASTGRARCAIPRRAATWPTEGYEGRGPNRFW
jgi:hypothetical protein